MSYQSRKGIDIVLMAPSIKKNLKKRIEELNLSYSMIVNEAKALGMKGITKSSISCYLNYNPPKNGSLSQKHIIWLCLRYGVKLSVRSELLEYNEEQCKKELSKFF